jgi:hypothetical protein
MAALLSRASIIAFMTSLIANIRLISGLPLSFYNSIQNQYLQGLCVQTVDL